MDSFEEACKHWEQLMKDFIDSISDGGIPTLRNAQWDYTKKRINVYPADQHGKKKRGASGPSYLSESQLNRNAAEAVWKLFKQFSTKHSLDKIERLRNNEKELGRYDFRASNCCDEFSCHIYLPGEWNRSLIYLSMFIGPRYRKVDL